LDDASAVYQSEVARFIAWLWGKETQLDATGRLAAHVRSRGYKLSPVQSQMKFEAGPSIGGFPHLLAAWNTISARYIERWPDLDAIRTSIKFYGPPVSQSDFDAALLAFRSS